MVGYFKAIRNEAKMNEAHAKVKELKQHVWAAEKQEEKEALEKQIEEVVIPKPKYKKLPFHFNIYDVTYFFINVQGDIVLNIDGEKIGILYDAEIHEALKQRFE